MRCWLLKKKKKRKLPDELNCQGGNVNNVNEGRGTGPGPLRSPLALDEWFGLALSLLLTLRRFSCLSGRCPRTAPPWHGLHNATGWPHCHTIVSLSPVAWLEKSYKYFCATASLDELCCLIVVSLFVPSFFGASALSCGSLYSFFFFLMAHDLFGRWRLRGQKKTFPVPLNADYCRLLTEILWCEASWELWWTSRPHAPLQHSDPHHVTKECTASFVLTPTALMELRAFLHSTEWLLAWHFASPFSPQCYSQTGFASCSLLHLLNHFKRYWSLFHPKRAPI